MKTWNEEESADLAQVRPESVLLKIPAGEPSSGAAPKYSVEGSAGWTRRE
jgi:hypothetical protein